MDLLKDLECRLPEIEARLGYRFEDRKWLMTAFVHPSFVNEYHKEPAEHNERLEFLGDAVLSLIISGYLFQNFPHLPEGELSPMRARLVDAKSCANYLDALEVADFLLLGKGQKLTMERGKTSIHADLFEAILGAIYLDGQLEAARHFFFTHFRSSIEQLLEEPDENFKALLQKYAQREKQETPEYVILSEEGPDHAKSFCIAVLVAGSEVGVGEGQSKKSAQQEAARAACRALGLISVEGGVGGKDEE